MLPADIALTRVLINISGSVQGVGFRPFIFRLAQDHQLVGSISNTCNGVKIDVQGSREAIANFQNAIVEQKPERARISELACDQVPLGSATAFQIAPSESGSDKSLALLPDTAMCPACLKELFDPHNRRYQYPFLHCISCGPRFSLFLRMPFDRGNTTMTEFNMCADCRDEYDNPNNRRFYSQTNCCPKCGPQLQLVDAKGSEVTGKKDALNAAAQYLKDGKIVAMKNTGGYLLLVDAGNEEAVMRLRRKKRRGGKPFALLLPSLATVDSIAHASQNEKNILASPPAPIVLLRKKNAKDDIIAHSVAHESPYYGVMLPHNAMQYLLLHQLDRPLVATSGNIAGRPLCITEEEAFDALSSVADVFLIHNRKIKHRLDDSIVHVIADQPVIMRKARGYIPCAIPIPEFIKANPQQNLFAAGSHMKNSFAFMKQRQIYISQYIGDLDSVENCKAYDEEVSHWETLLGIDQMEGVGDRHPDYYSSHYLKKRTFASAMVQHHKAHVWAAVAEHKLSSPFLSLSWDGTGWGEDLTVWGGEAFITTMQGMKRFASLYPFPLPGGEKAVKQPRRSMLGLLHAMDESRFSSLHETFAKEELAILTVALKSKINTPNCSSMGRLFDGVSAILGLCMVSDYEGQAAILLESLAHKAEKNGKEYLLPIVKEKDLYLLDWRRMLKQILDDKMQGMPCEDIALAFHETLAKATVELAKLAGEEIVLLTGGVMQNKLLVERAVALLKAEGFKPYLHRDIPPNDGGIAIGQIIGRLVEG